MMTLKDLLDLAYSHAKRTGNSSAALCVADAHSLINRGDEVHARARLLTSLRHSVGICHTDYATATAERFEVYNSEDGATISGPEGLSYSAALAFAADWNHSGAPRLFRVRAWQEPTARGFTGYNGFTAGVN